MNKNKLISLLLDLAPLILFIVLLIVFSLIDPRIVSLQNLTQILINSAPIAILAVGAMVDLISGGIDLSAGYGVSMCAVIFASFLANDYSLLTAVFVALLFVLLIGVFNGVFVGLFDVQPFIVTLSSMIIIQGVTLIVATSGTLMIMEPVLKTIGIESTMGIPNIIILTAVLLGIIYILLHKNKFGVRTYSIGSNQESSQTSGVPVARQQIYIYLFSGLCTAITAILLVSRVSIVSPNIG